MPFLISTPYNLGKLICKWNKEHNKTRDITISEKEISWVRIYVMSNDRYDLFLSLVFFLSEQLVLSYHHSG